MYCKLRLCEGKKKPGFGNCRPFHERKTMWRVAFALYSQHGQIKSKLTNKHNFSQNTQALKHKQRRAGVMFFFNCSRLW